MAIEFKSAPVAVPEAESSGPDIFALVNENGQLSLILLIVFVVVIFAIVTYLRTTPGYRITDIRIKRGKKDAGAVSRARTPAPPPETPEEATGQS